MAIIQFSLSHVWFMMPGAQIIPESADLSDTIKKAYAVNRGASGHHRRVLLTYVSCYLESAITRGWIAFYVPILIEP